VRILIATRGFAHPGGSETYVLTVAEQFERLGHEVTIVADDLGPIAEFARDRGLIVTSSLNGLEQWCDAVRQHASAVQAEAEVVRQARERAERERARLADELGRADAILHTRRVRGGLLVGRAVDAVRRRVPGPVDPRELLPGSPDPV
jgi:hypothetical protein